MAIAPLTTMAALPAEQRPIERLARLGEDRLSDAELVAVLLGAGTRRRPVLPLAQELLMRCGGVAGLVDAGLRELEQVVGVGRVRAARLRAALELGRRAQIEQAPALATLGQTEHVIAYFAPRLGGLPHEELHLVLLDVRNRAFRVEQIARGGLTGVSVHPREILRPAIREHAASMILVHNHPSGESAPSRADHDLTDRVRRAGELVGIPLLDHVIVTRHGGFSLGGRQ